MNSSNTTKKIRSFIYLDEYKMYSISSQIFEGLTEFIINYESSNKQEMEEQKGPIASGRLLADIISKEIGSQQKKFLHDYSYNLFEDELSKSARIIEINSENIAENISNLDNYELIKVTGYADFMDLKVMSNMFEKYNEIGTALTYITTFGELEHFEKAVKDTISKTRDRNEKARMMEKSKSMRDIGKIAMDLGLQIDKSYLSNLKKVLDFGFKDQLQFNVPIPILGNKTIVFSAVLNRELLKESVDLIVQKIAHHTEKNHTIFGIITQSKGVSPEINNNSIDEDKDNFEEIVPQEEKHLKQVVREIFPLLANIEETFTGKLQNEVIIDPIAVYREF